MSKPWSEMTRQERSARLGDPSRWENPRGPTEAREAELVRRLLANEPLTVSDRKEAKRLARALQGKA